LIYTINVYRRHPVVGKENAARNRINNFLCGWRADNFAYRGGHISNFYFFGIDALPKLAVERIEHFDAVSFWREG